jgi:hypothetical protein
MFAPPVPKPKPKQRAPKPSTDRTRQSRRLPVPVQAKPRVGCADSPLEHEADRVAAKVMAMTESDAATGAAGPQAGGIQPKLRADAAGGPLRRDEAAPSPESFGGRGSPLMATARGFFERRFGYDFGDVRIHGGADAAASARSLGARAYTFGSDIVFGAGEYSPGSQRSQALLAHELAHVVQQEGGQSLVQRSPDVRAEIDWAVGKGEDADWVAERIRQKKLGDTTGVYAPKGRAGQKIEIHFILGSTPRRALVIGGVHGIERAGMEVTRELLAELTKKDAPQPVFTTIIVPVLFPDNRDSRTRESGQDDPKKRRKDDPPLIHTNRNFPYTNLDLAAAKAAGGGTAKDTLGNLILPENLLLIELIERFKPERIISIHGTRYAGAAGVFYDPRHLRKDELAAAEVWARGVAPLVAGLHGEDSSWQEVPPLAYLASIGEEAQVIEAMMVLAAQASGADRKLVLDAAKLIDKKTVGMTDRKKRDFDRELEAADLRRAGGKKLEDLQAKSRVNRAARLPHASVAGNVGRTGLDNPFWTGSPGEGVSLGPYAAAKGISVFTVEPPLYPDSDAYERKTDDIDRAHRETELKAYAEAVRTILLGAP